jgi:hypothetical protein
MHQWFHYTPQKCQACLATWSLLQLFDLLLNSCLILFSFTILSSFYTHSSLKSTCLLSIGYSTNKNQLLFINIRSVEDFFLFFARPTFMCDLKNIPLISVTRSHVIRQIKGLLLATDAVFWHTANKFIAHVEISWYWTISKNYTHWSSFIM